MLRLVAATVLFALSPALAPWQGRAAAQEPYVPTIEKASTEGADAIAGFRPAPGLRVDLVAAEPSLANPVAFTIDDQGGFWVVETHRIRDGVFDTRDHMYWLDEDLAGRTVDDRVAMYRKHMADSLAKVARDHERIRLLRDRDGDGTAETATVFADGFRDLADGIAAGILRHGDDVWFTCIPKLWRLRDDDGDGVVDQRQAVHDGFGVHVSLIGHDMHGLAIGPDRRLYFSIGDRGFHVEADGRVFAFPHTGAVLRCELDGSDLEVVHTGLRNPQELAFDEFGDLFTGDNNSDGGDRARIVQIVDGGDSGWQIGYQWLETRGAWNEERLWLPWFPEQAASIVPPIANVAHGPSGFAFYPGTGLPERYRGRFLLCDFRGAAPSSGVLSIALAPHGAGFELAHEDRFVWNVLATDVEFGPDGGAYVLDWVTGWTKTGKGRIYRVHAPALADDPAIADTRRILTDGMAGRGSDELEALLAHADLRVRRAAQFALADRGPDAAPVLAGIARRPDHRLARLHAIQGLGILGRRHRAVLDHVVPLLRDGDAEVRAQAARAIGDARAAIADERLRTLVAEDPSSRVRACAATALGRIGDPGAVDALVGLLRQNHDRDPYLRHAAVVALSRCADAERLGAFVGDGSRAVRLGVLLALRHLRSPEVARFLDDPDGGIVREAARAIYDQPIDAAMPALAALLTRTDATDVPLWRRVVNANRVLGGHDHGRALAEFAARADVTDELRIEALTVLGEWAAPHGQDRVFGNWRPLPRRNALAVRVALSLVLESLLADGSERVAVAAARAAGQLEARDGGAALARAAGDRARGPDVRNAALLALEKLGDRDRLVAVSAAVSREDPAELRQTAIRILAEVDPVRAVPSLAALAESTDGETGERQNALTTLGSLATPAATRVLGQWLDRLERDEAPAELRLDLIEAAAGQADEALAERARALASPRDLERGGDRRRGRKLFAEHVAAQCTRCHRVGGSGGEAGPTLDGIGARPRDWLVRSLLEPAAEIAAGFASIVVRTADDTAHAGVQKREADGVLELENGEGVIERIPVADIVERSEPGSAMPAMTALLTRRELRDLVEYLASLDRVDDRSGR